MLCHDDQGDVTENGSPCFPLLKLEAMVFGLEINWLQRSIGAN